MKKISILIITYNQEKFIRRTLDSILIQKEWGLHHIIISDDCSKDSTWDILLEYQKQYPDIIQPYRNETNLGIYGNSEVLHSKRGDSDLYLFLDGDDAICPGFLETTQSYIENNKINTESKIGLFYDWKVIDPSGEESVYKMSVVKYSHQHPFCLSIRGRVSYRGVVFSGAVLNEYKPVILNKGLNLAEYMYDAQGIRLLDYYYYVPFVGTIYYTGIGISTTLSFDTPYYREEDIIKWDYFIENYSRTKKDRFWMLACRERTICKMKFSFANYFKLLYYYIRGVAWYDLSPKRVLKFLSLRRYSLY